MKKKSPSRSSSISLEAADGVLKIINVKMEEAIKAVSSARGYDIRDFTLVAFGGGGPMHAGRMALDLGIPSVLIPLTPGVHSALGLLMSDVKHDYVRSKLVGLDELDLDEINHLFHQLIEQAKAELRGEGFRDERDQDRTLSGSALRRPGLRADRSLHHAAAQKRRS